MIIFPETASSSATPSPNNHTQSILSEEVLPNPQEAESLSAGNWSLREISELCFLLFFLGKPGKGLQEAWFYWSWVSAAQWDQTNWPALVQRDPIVRRSPSRPLGGEARHGHTEVNGATRKRQEAPKPCLCSARSSVVRAAGLCSQMDDEPAIRIPPSLCISLCGPTWCQESQKQSSPWAVPNISTLASHPPTKMTPDCPFAILAMISWSYLDRPLGWHSHILRQRT